MADPQVGNFRFGLNGLINAIDSEGLSDAQYRKILNMDALQEGLLYSRTGRKKIGAMGASTTCAMIRKVVVTPGEDPLAPSVNPRYVGAGGNVYRTADYSTFASVCSGLYDNTKNNRFSLASYSGGNVGSAWAYLAGDLKMAKDRAGNPYSSLPEWGILPAFRVALSDIAGSGNLDGGDSASPNNTQPYDYRYRYVASDTGNEGNPSQTQLSDSAAGSARSDSTKTGTPISVHLKSVTVTVWGTGDPQIGSIAIYRRGGTLYDTWRLVGRVSNPGAGSSATYTDNTSDVDLQPAPQITLDNDPPISSSPPSPYTGEFSGAISAGIQTVTVVGGLGTQWLQYLTPGSLLHIFYNNPEDVIIESVNVGAGTITAYFQHTHAANTDWEVDTITAQPCCLVMPYQQFLLVAGDPNNPHILYRSKGDQPEAFAPVPADGTVASVSCGTPSNPIMNFCEFRGQITTLNLMSIFETVVLQGSLIQPYEAAKKGVVSRWAWCKTDSEIWFVATDGVWSWDGGSLTRRSWQIDALFRGELYNGIQPLDMTPSGVNVLQMEYRRGEVFLTYKDITGAVRTLVCSSGPSGDRWKQFNLDITVGTEQPIDFMFLEADTGSLVIARQDPSGAVFSIAEAVSVNQGVLQNYTSDEWTTDASAGTAIPFDVSLPWFDMKSPNIKKFFQEFWLEAYNVGTTVTVQVFLDYDESTVKDTFTVPLTTITPGTWALCPFQPNLVTKSGNLQSFGWEARAISFRIFGTAQGRLVSFRSLSFQYTPTGIATGGASTDWMDLGHKHDKRLYQMIVTFDSEGVDQTLVMDTMNGIAGKTYNESIQSFVLSNPTILGPGRAMKSFPVTDGTIAKLIRLRAVSTVNEVGAGVLPPVFKILDVEFEKEMYPPDVVSFTEWDDGGYAYDKFANQVTLDVDTNGVPITVKVQADGSDKFTFAVTSSQATRDQNITLPTGLMGKRWRLYVDPSQTAIATGGGKFQLFNPKGIFRFQQADRGEVGHTFDWDDLEHPWDKQLRSVTVEWDNTGNSNVTAQLDTITGVNGQTLNSNVAQFVLSGGRSKKEFPLPADTVAKMIRLYPLGTPASSFKQWKYLFDFDKDPQDVVLFTPWNDFEWPYEKIARNLILTVDTGGSNATVTLQADGNNMQTVTVNTTYTDRQRVIPLNSNLIGKLWRLVITPGSSGLFKLWKWSIDPINEPPYVDYWDSYEQGFGYLGWKLIKQVWAEYISPSSLTMTIYRDGGVQFYQNILLGAHAVRDVERFYPPSAVGSVYNKSKIYRVTFSSVSPFKIYPESSGIEFLPMGMSRRQGYEKIALSQFMKLAV